MRKVEGIGLLRWCKEVRGEGGRGLKGWQS